MKHELSDLCRENISQRGTASEFPRILTKNEGKLKSVFQ